MDNTTLEYKVSGKIIHTPDIVTLKLVLLDGSIPEYIPGQFITVYFPDTGILEGKSYSISNTPGEGVLEITIKRMGVFSHKLCDMKVGEYLQASLPYGYFYTEELDTPVVIISAGIGVAPFVGMIPDMISRNKKRPISLFWSVTKNNDLFAQEKFTDIEEKNKKFSAHYFVTRESIYASDRIHCRRISVEDVRPYSADCNTEFFICGSISFVRDVWKLLKNMGVPDERIYTESFF